MEQNHGVATQNLVPTHRIHSGSAHENPKRLKEHRLTSPSKKVKKEVLGTKVFFYQS